MSTDILHLARSCPQRTLPTNFSRTRPSITSMSCTRSSLSTTSVVSVLFLYYLYLTIESILSPPTHYVSFKDPDGPLTRADLMYSCLAYFSISLHLLYRKRKKEKEKKSSISNHNIICRKWPSPLPIPKERTMIQVMQKTQSLIMRNTPSSP